VEEHIWVFPDGNATGKLTAHWLWKAKKELGLGYLIPDRAQTE
jgi:hypothetical protein